MKKLLILLLFPLMMFAQESIVIGDVDCSGEVNSEDASLILQFVTNVINELPCQDNMTGLTPEQLQEIINMMDEQLIFNYSGGGNFPIMISSISSETMFLGDAFVYCNDLVEDGYDNWFLPNLEQLTYAISGGCELPDERTDNKLWTSSSSFSSYDGITVRESSYNTIQATGTSGGSEMCRCVRFGENQTGETPSNSSDSSVLGGLEQPITMIGPMYITDEFEFTSIYQLNNNTTSNSTYYFDAVRFCAQLEYNGFNDWFLPSLNQLHSYYENNISIGIVIPNFTSGESTFWTRINNNNIGSDLYAVRIKSSDSSLPNQMSYVENPSGSSAEYCFCVR